MSVIRIAIALLLVAAVSGELTACGKKGDLEPPPAKEEPKKKPS